MVAPPLLCVGGFLLLIQLFSSHSINMMGHIALGAQWSHPIHPPSQHYGEGSFPGHVPPSDMLDSEFVVDIKPGDSGIVSEHSVAQSHIYPGFMGRASTLTLLPCEPGCEDYSFLDQAVMDFEHGLDSGLTDSDITPELEASFDEADAGPSSFS